MEKTKKNLGKKILSLMFYVIIIFLILYIMVSLFLPKQTVNIFGFKPYVVITNSMEPELMKDDLIFVKSPNYEELTKGDIITFYGDLYLDGEIDIVTHYINSITEVDGVRYYRTNGYQLPVDNWVLNDEDILGSYLFKIPFLGNIVNFVKSPFGIAAVAVNVGVIIAIVILLKKDKTNEIKDDIKEEEK